MVGSRKDPQRREEDQRHHHKRAQAYLKAAVLVDRFAILLIASLNLMMLSRSRPALNRSSTSLGELSRKTGLLRKLLIKPLSSGSIVARCSGLSSYRIFSPLPAN